MVSLKFNWGKAQTEPVEMDNAFEIQRIYVKKNIMARAMARKCLPLP